ncbi:M42 family metallopeptidase [Oceanirhabdus seepicola]|uniref:M20/M25/M40 family metallo-hydrolase n=1 Tax=Oceanirhabdus seepicola TaxID=2828781 RepID=A0A9J6P156_9CLOT|nr:M20/M25/M40 family metallo-hydrolase [Oceanirhabdus seepicola]MCM1989597.1 M20/M25/M40 family metallo-hydrolase [Oceanirhabdus seepicola]
MKANSIELIKKLSNAYGAPGFEDDVVELIKKDYGHVFNIKEDSMRNLVLYRKNHTGTKPSIMLDGHSDEVAFIIQSIKANGTMRFLPLGGWMAQNVPAHKVMIKNEDGNYIEGIIATKPPHFITGEVGLQPISDMVIDVGATSYDEVINVFKIEPGSPVVPHAEFSFNEVTGVMLGKAFDNRLGCGCVLETLLALEGLDLSVDVIGSISVQEEVGCRGAKVNANTIKPDLAIVFEGSPADDTFMDKYDSQGALKKGTQIRHYDRSLIANHRLISLAKSTAKEKKIPYQCAVRRGGGTDAGPIHIEESSVPCLILGTPVRYAHTHYGFSALTDYKTSIDLAVELIRNMTVDTLNSL